MDRGVLAKAETMAQRTILTEAEAAFIDAQRVARLATADAEGNPHVIPICYAFDGMERNKKGWWQWKYSCY